VTNGSLFSQAGIQQQTKWGGNYQVTVDGSRGTSDAPLTTYPLSLQSHMSGVVNQPLLRNFKMDALREQVQLTRAQLKVADLGLQQRITQTSRSVRAAYYNLVGAIAGLDVAQQSLDLSRQSLKDNQVRLEVGTIPSIDLVSSEAEVAANEEAVIIQEAAIGTAEDQFRTLIMNPSQPAFWTTTFRPTDQPSLTPHAIDVDAAVKNALANRTDILQFKKQIEGTDIGIHFAQNQRLPEVDLQGRYGATGIGGQEISFGNALDGSPIVLGQSNRGFGDVLRDVFGNSFRAWSVAVNVSYPIGMSQADASLAQGRVQRKQQNTQLTDLEVQVTAAVRDAGRQVNANLKRVEADTKARELAQQRLDAEQKRFAVGLSSTFELFQAQRDLASARQRELGAVIAYNQSLVDFETVQIAPLR